jgi:crotonobetainyl-CoA:carnitine CoA-transferase CaiB-like acyl-CoA transferase
MAAPRPLEGLLVVSLEQAVAAPLCTARLADAGARVIKVERPGGDFARYYDKAGKGLSSYFVWLNRGKESVVLDLKAADDLALLRRLIARADVLVQNLAPGSMDKLGLGWAALSALNPRLIACGIAGYGPGPFEARKAYDLLIQAEAGISSVTGTPDGPARVGVSLVDIGTGMYAHAAILEALIARGVSGKGAEIAVPMFDAMADWMTVPLLQAEASGRNPARIGLAHVSIAPYGAYACGCGGAVLFGVQSELEWVRFCETVLEEPELATATGFTSQPERVENRAALDARIAAVFARLDREAVIARLEAARIAYGRLSTALDLSAHPHLTRMTVPTPGGPVDLPLPPQRVGGAAPMLGPVPDLDEHGPRIRAEFGA